MNFTKSKKVFLIALILGNMLLLAGCGMTAKDYYLRGTNEIYKYNCVSSTKDLKKASEMELKDEGNWYPIYMLELGLARYYCNDLEGALKAFQVLDNYAVLRSNRNIAEKGFEFLKSKNKRTYELTEREETLLHYYMGIINYRLGNYSDALIEFKKVDYIANGVYSKLPLIALVRGLTYVKLGDNGNALVAFKKVAEQNPTSPVGFFLAYSLEQVSGNKEYWKNKLKNKFAINIDKKLQEGKETILFVESYNNVSSNDTMVVKYNNLYEKAYLLDVVDPDFNFGDFLVKGLKEVASKLLRDAAKRTLAKVPGLGILSSIVLGNDEEDTRAWRYVPKMYFVTLNYLKPQNYNVTIELKNDDNEVIKSKIIDIDNENKSLFVTNF